GRVGFDAPDLEHPARNALLVRRPQPGRMAARIERVAARQVQRQAEAEGPALAHLRHALAHLVRVDEVEATELVVGTEIAPGGSFGPVDPARAGRGGRRCHVECLLSRARGPAVVVDGWSSRQLAGSATKISTRRLRARPAAVVLSAIGS